MNPVDYKIWGIMQERVYQTESSVAYVEFFARGSCVIVVGQLLQGTT